MTDNCVVIGQVCKSPEWTVETAPSGRKYLTINDLQILLPTGFGKVVDVTIDNDTNTIRVTSAYDG